MARRPARKRKRRRSAHAARIQRGRLAAGTGVSIGAALGMGATAEAADFTVTNLNDAGAGSLRQAILDANTAPGPDRVLFQSGLTGQITLASQIQITGPTELLGSGPDKLTLSGSGNNRILYAKPTNPGDDVVVSGLSLVRGNVPLGDGGAINSEDADLTIRNSTISGNVAGGDGGGVYIVNGRVTVIDSTISANRTLGRSGGGIYAYDGGVIQNSTISGNHGYDAAGGIYLQRDTLTIESSTIAGNSSSNRGGGGVFTFQTSGVVTLRNTIVADNTGPDDPDLGAFDGSFGAAFSLIEHPTAPIASIGPNLTGVDPKLSGLADNGGPTQTMALNDGSPALDQGQASGVDQRGAPRPFDFAQIALVGSNQADIGAYERVLCGDVAVNRIGTEGSDTISGTPGPDGVIGLGGNDTLIGLGGKDVLCGGSGKDRLKGGAGNDRLLGEAGKDTLVGGKGKDVLKGGSGKDVLKGGKGKDVLKGGAGKDVERQ